MFYKIDNLLQADTTCDYKGLNIDLFVIGSQVYPCDFSQRNYCIVESTEVVSNLKDVTELTQEEYELLKLDILEFNKNNTPLTDVEQLRLEMAESNIELFEMMMAMNGGIS